MVDVHHCTSEVAGDTKTLCNMGDPCSTDCKAADEAKKHCESDCHTCGTALGAGPS